MSHAAVCFDLDDTLFDYHHYARAGLASAAAHLRRVTGESYHEDLRALYFDADVTEGTFDALVERHDLPAGLVPDLVEAFHDGDGPLVPYPTVEPVLARLGRDHALGLLTDGRGGHAKLERLGLAHHFDAVLVTPTVDASKRERRVFERVLDDLGVAPREAMYVGDDPRVDFTHPNRLGMTTVRLRRGRYADVEAPDSDAVPDHEIRSLPALLSLVGVERVPDP